MISQSEEDSSTRPACALTSDNFSDKTGYGVFEFVLIMTGRAGQIEGVSFGSRDDAILLGTCSIASEGSAKQGGQYIIFGESDGFELESNGNKSVGLITGGLSGSFDKPTRKPWLR